jgi:hypothetical protein
MQEKQRLQNRSRSRSNSNDKDKVNPEKDEKKRRSKFDVGGSSLSRMTSTGKQSEGLSALSALTSMYKSTNLAQ